MATTTKVNVTLPADIAEATRAAAPGGNVSAYVAKALREQLLRDSLSLLVLEGHTGVPDDVAAAMEQDRVA